MFRAVSGTKSLMLFIILKYLKSFLEMLAAVRYPLNIEYWIRNSRLYLLLVLVAC